VARDLISSCIILKQSPIAFTVVVFVVARLEAVAAQPLQAERTNKVLDVVLFAHRRDVIGVVQGLVARGADTAPCYLIVLLAVRVGLVLEKARLWEWTLACLAAETFLVPMCIESYDEFCENWFLTHLAGRGEFLIVTLLAVRFSFIFDEYFVVQALVAMTACETLGVPFIAHGFCAIIENGFVAFRAARTETFVVAVLAVAFLVARHESAVADFGLAY